jgi:cell wall-associated NlpC family hydrolase
MSVRFTPGPGALRTASPRLLQAAAVALRPGRLRGRAGMALVALALAAGGCASRVDLPSKDSALGLRVQNSAIAPGNGGELIDGRALQPGDILLTSVATLNSFAIRLGTFSPVSHAVLYLGDGQIAEAVGTGVRARSLAEVIGEEQMVVAFRIPDLDAQRADRVRAWALSQVGTRYNTTGVLLDAPFVLNRRVCELPLIPSAVSQFCVTGLATVQLGASRDDQFFCSQFVLEAYRQAGLPITQADPRWVSPADLLHMREGDVPSIAATQPLRYVGHLKYNPPPVIVVDGAASR